MTTKRRRETATRIIKDLYELHHDENGNWTIHLDDLGQITWGILNRELGDQMYAIAMEVEKNWKENNK